MHGTVDALTDITWQIEDRVWEGPAWIPGLFKRQEVSNEMNSENLFVKLFKNMPPAGPPGAYAFTPI